MAQALPFFPKWEGGDSTPSSTPRREALDLIYHAGANATLSSILRSDDEEMLEKCTHLLWGTAQKAGDEMGDERKLFEFILAVFLRAQNYRRTQAVEFAHPPATLPKYRLCNCQRNNEELTVHLRARRQCAIREHAVREVQGGAMSTGK